MWTSRVLKFYFVISPFPFFCFSFWPKPFKTKKNIYIPLHRSLSTKSRIIKWPENHSKTRISANNDVSGYAWVQVWTVGVARLPKVLRKDYRNLSVNSLSEQNQFMCKYHVMSYVYAFFSSIFFNDQLHFATSFFLYQIEFWGLYYFWNVNFKSYIDRMFECYFNSSYLN